MKIKQRTPTRCNNDNSLIFILAQRVSGSSYPIFRSARLWLTACGIMSPDCCRLRFTPPTFHLTKPVEQRPPHRTHSPLRRTAGLRPTAIWGHIACCKAQSCAPEDGQRISRNMLSLFEDQYIVIVASSWSCTLFLSMMHGQTHTKLELCGLIDTVWWTRWGIHFKWFFFCILVGVYRFYLLGIN